MKFFCSELTFSDIGLSTAPGGDGGAATKFDKIGWDSKNSRLAGGAPDTY